MIIGIVGKPNVGKSAFFRALTLAEAESGNFPFTTIKANSAIGYVKVDDPAVPYGQHSKPRNGYVLGNYRFVPVQVIDVAGLVPGASEGKGLGNKFLNDLRDANALIHIIDLSGSTNERGESVEINSYDPANDINFLEIELDKWFYNIIEKHWKNIEKKIRMQNQKIDSALAEVVSGLNITKEQVTKSIAELKINIENINENLFNLSRKLREISKPIIIAANKCDLLIEDDLWKIKIKKLKEKFPNYKIVPVVAEYEYNLKKATKEKIISYIPGEAEFSILDETKLTEKQKKGLETISKNIKKFGGTGVQETINYAVFNLLEYIPIFPGSEKSLLGKIDKIIPDCFLMPKNTTALEFAYKIHTDFGKNFIRAIDVKNKMIIGKDHILKFGDVVEIINSK